MRDIVDVLANTSAEIFEEKMKALKIGDKAVTQQIDNGNDIMSILSAYHLLPWYNYCWHIVCVVRANMAASEEDRLSKEELLGQMS